MTQQFFSKSSAVENVSPQRQSALFLWFEGNRSHWLMKLNKRERLFFLFHRVCPIQHSWGDKRRDSGGILQDIMQKPTL